MDESLLAEVLANPHDDAPRLILADWLEERGDLRADFIRVQCELAAGVEDEDRSYDLLSRDADLRAEFGEEWSAPVSGLVDNCVFVRGFVGFVTVGNEELITNQDAIFQAAPIQSAVIRIYSSRFDLKQFEDQHLRKLTALGLVGSIHDVDVASVAASAATSGLTRLLLSGLTLTCQSALAIAESPWLKNLEMLDLSRNQIRNGGAEALAESEAISKIQALNLSENEIRLKGARALANSPNLGKLRHLDIRSNPIPQRGVDELRRRFGRDVCEI